MIDLWKFMGAYWMRYVGRCCFLSLKGIFADIGSLHSWSKQMKTTAFEFERTCSSLSTSDIRIWCIRKSYWTRASHGFLWLLGERYCPFQTAACQTSAISSNLGHGCVTYPWLHPLLNSLSRVESSFGTCETIFLLLLYSTALPRYLVLPHCHGLWFIRRCTALDLPFSTS